MSTYRKLGTHIATTPEKKILIIDDEVDTVNMFKRFLEKARPEYKLTSLTEPLKAIDTIRSCKPDIILLDYEMPDLNGLDLLKKIQEFNNSLPVIFLTAYPEYRQQAVDAGAVDYFVKARTPWIRLSEKIDLILSEQHPSETMFTALVTRYKEELEFLQKDINNSEILPTCIELTKEGVIRELRSEICYRDNFDLLDSLKDQLIGNKDHEPKFINDPDILASVKSFFPNNIDMILAQPLNVTHSKHSIWLIFGLKCGDLIKEENIPFFAHWSKYYEDAIEELYRIKISRDHALTMLRRSATDLTRLGLSLGQLDDQSSALYEIRVELEQNTREMNLLAGALKSGKTDKLEHSLSEITQKIVNKNKAWAEINGVNISYEYNLDKDDGGLLLDTIKWSFVVNTLVSNAIDVFLFNDVNNGEQQDVLVRLIQVDGCVVLDVLDNGCGIRKQAIDKLIQQGWSTKGMHRGWGLYLSAEICRNNRVLLEFESPVDNNWSTRFRLVFPH